MKIFDCFLFFNEIWLSKLRMAELENTVDYFVLVEATRTHSGNSKPLYFKENKSQFRRWENKILDFQIDLDTGATNFERENEHRIKIFNCLKESVKPDDDDIIMVSDLDEIPNKKVLPRHPPHYFHVQKNLMQLYFVYFLNFFSGKTVTGTSIASWRRLKEIDDLFGNATQWLRNNKDRGEIIYDGGWHYSYMMGADQMKYKAESFLHADDFIEQTQSKSKDSPLSYFEKQIKNAIEKNYTPYSHRPIQKLNPNEGKRQEIEFSELLNGQTYDYRKSNWTVFPDELLDNKDKDLIFK